MEERRIGVVGTDNTHAHVFCAFLNGWDHERPIPTRCEDNPNAGPGMYTWATVLREMELEDSPRVPIPGARVTRIWSEQRGDAQRIADACGIETVCDTPADACRDVDAVLVLSERPEQHLEHARPALEAGLDTYIDKPVCATVEDARALQELARAHGARWFTGSALRWSPELHEIAARASEQVGEVTSIYVECPNDMALYGIHAVEMANVCIGGDVRSVRAVQLPGRETTFVEYEGGRVAVLDNVHGFERPSYHVVLYGPKGHRYVELRDFGTPFYELLVRFVAMLHGGPVPVPPDEALALMGVVIAARRSLETGAPEGVELAQPATHA